MPRTSSARSARVSTRARSSPCSSRVGGAKPGGSCSALISPAYSVTGAAYYGARWVGHCNTIAERGASRSLLPGRG